MRPFKLLVTLKLASGKVYTAGTEFKQSAPEELIKEAAVHAKFPKGARTIEYLDELEVRTPVVTQEVKEPVSVTEVREPNNNIPGTNWSIPDAGEPEEEEADTVADVMGEEGAARGEEGADTGADAAKEKSDKPDLQPQNEVIGRKGKGKQGKADRKTK